jgi:hypothetical protein
MSMRRRLFAVAGLIATVALMSAVVLAADMGMMAAAQMKNAIAQAKAAQKAESLSVVKEHLQNIVNCIEGPKGAMFKAMGANPCQGNGLLADAKDAGGKYADATPWIELANENAAAGLKAATLGKARAAGWAVQNVLEHAEKAMMGQ